MTDAAYAAEQVKDSGRRGETLLRSAFIVSSTGDWIYRFALPLLVLRQTGSAISTAITYVLEIIPYVAVGLFAGTIADRADRRRLMISCDGIAAALVGVMAVLLFTGKPSIWLLYALALLLGTVRPVYVPAFQGFLVDRVPESRRPVMNAWVQGTDAALSMLGPVVGITVIALIGPATACAANSVSFAASALLIRWAPHGAAGRARVRWGEIARNVGGDFKDGLVFIRDSAPLLWGTALMTVTNFAALGLEANLIYIVTDDGRSRQAALALVFAGQGAGALLGASLAPAVIRRFPVGPTLTAAMGLMAVSLALPALSPSTPVIGGSMFLLGMSTSAIVVPWYTFRQSIVPSELIGRVTSVGRSLSFVTIPLGALFGSWVMGQWSAATLFLVAGVLQGAVWLGTLLSPLRKAGTTGTR
ncbi:MFS transporter [Streptomyces sp. NPDC059443]|uniref:MFS transporter n=1 Tax=unclassified Streptomyces TaxID=2593676 RepID=UPI00368303FC